MTLPGAAAAGGILGVAKLETSIRPLRAEVARRARTAFPLLAAARIHTCGGVRAHDGARQTFGTGAHPFVRAGVEHQRAVVRDGTHRDGGCALPIGDIRTAQGSLSAIPPCPTGVVAAAAVGETLPGARRSHATEAGRAIAGRCTRCALGTRARLSAFGGNIALAQDKLTRGHARGITRPAHRSGVQHSQLPGSAI